MSKNMRPQGRSIVSNVSNVASDVIVYQQDPFSELSMGAIPVAAYCRVSTDMELQQSSLELQMSTYQELIDSHPGWVLAGIYADKGISGTTIKGREQFNRMIEDAKSGKIRYILAKSISRFARNTVDMLKTVRELKEIGVGIYFEKEHIDTLKVQSEFVLTIFAATAQEDIMTLSSNLKQGIRMRYEAGLRGWSNIYGYYREEGDNRKDGSEWQINEEQAALIRRMFRLKLEGVSCERIAEMFTAEGIPTPKGNSRWEPCVIGLMLKNEAFAGDLLMQKTYVADPIRHISKHNRHAEIKQYYRRDHHRPIVSRETYNHVQWVTELKNSLSGVCQYPYYGYLLCPICGAKMICYKDTTAGLPYAWTCGGKGPEKLREKRTTCPPYIIHQKYIDRAVWDSLRAVSDEDLKRLGNDSELGALANEMLAYKQAHRHSRKDPVEYYMVMRFIDRITFPKWNQIEVTWRVGLKSTAEIVYEVISEQPYAKLEIRGKEYFYGGEKLWRGKIMYKSILNRQEYCNKVKIIDVPRLSPYIDDMEGIPRVLAQRSKHYEDEAYGR